MIQSFFTRIVSTLLLVVLILVGSIQSSPAITFTGDYLSDGQAVIASLRESLGEFETEEAGVAAHEDAKVAIEGFYARYHGPRYTKLQSFTTLRTVFNTLASNYRTERPLRDSQSNRVLQQLSQAEAALQRGR
ncbi:MAG: photosystem II protein Psb27 [Synechococcaceae cyanobacterium SM2_3_1]|nr:photosystem II protein Psb27 [Synechococcaceae cyanobacterium SM2_3_1]